KKAPPKETAVMHGTDGDLGISAEFAGCFSPLFLNGWIVEAGKRKEMTFAFSKAVLEVMRRYMYEDKVVAPTSLQELATIAESARMADSLQLSELHWYCMKEMEKCIERWPIPDEESMKALFNAIPDYFPLLRMKVIQRFLKADFELQASAQPNKCLVPIEALALMQKSDGTVASSIVANCVKSSVNGFIFTSNLSKIRLSDLDWMEENDRRHIEEIHFDITKSSYENSEPIGQMLQRFLHCRVLGYHWITNCVSDAIHHNGEVLIKLLQELQSNPHTKKIQLLRLFRKEYYPKNQECRFLFTRDVRQWLQTSCPILFDFPAYFEGAQQYGSFTEQEATDPETIAKNMQHLQGLRYYEIEKCDSKFQESERGFVAWAARRSSQPIIFKESEKSVAVSDASSLDDFEGDIIRDTMEKR
ncbi:MAG TPA: hypothetical protein VN457_05185, partial [Chlamydiales bacterium]|nr:hypothetical protein [Chlamydiales bacterium]